MAKRKPNSFGTGINYYFFGSYRAKTEANKEAAHFRKMGKWCSCSQSKGEMGGLASCLEA